MSHPFLHPKGKELLKRVATVFRHQQNFIHQDSHIIFVCGGSLADLTQMRPRFLEFAEKEIPNLRFFRAEYAQKDLFAHNEPDFYPIARFEDIIGAVSDCIILFPESPGSFTELGYFARTEEIARKLLVVHDAALQGKDSFILGVIHNVDLTSYFKPAIQLQYSDPNFGLVRDRLEQRQLVGKKRTRFEYKPHGKLASRERFLCTFEIIRLFPYLNLDGITYAYCASSEHLGQMGL